MGSKVESNEPVVLWVTGRVLYRHRNDHGFYIPLKTDIYIFFRLSFRKNCKELFHSFFQFIIYFRYLCYIICLSKQVRIENKVPDNLREDAGYLHTTNILPRELPKLY